MRLLLGDEGLDRLAATRVILFGVGGVGSFCAEALVGSGLGHLTLVDPDRVAASNVNRQVQALVSTLGTLKVEALRARLLDIRPEADVRAIGRRYELASRDDFALAEHDYVLDAIDSLSNKVGLIQHASALGCRVFTSMGASQKRDPTRVKVGSLWKSEGDPLARLVRKRLRHHGFHGEVTCVYSDEAPSPLFPPAGDAGGQAADAPSSDDLPDGAFARRINGSVMHVTATFGLFLAGLVVNDVVGGAPGGAPRVQSAPSPY